MGHIQDVSRWPTDGKEEMVECFYGAREREKKGIRWESWGVLQGGLDFWSVCSRRGAASISPSVCSSEETNWRCAVRGALDIMAM